MLKIFEELRGVVLLNLNLVLSYEFSIGKRLKPGYPNLLNLIYGIIVSLCVNNLHLSWRIRCANVGDHGPFSPSIPIEGSQFEAVSAIKFQALSNIES